MNVVLVLTQSKANTEYNHSMHFFVLSIGRAHHVTCKLLPTKNGLLMRSTV